VRGSRYALCGRLSTTGFDGAQADGKIVAGSVDSASAPATASRYSVQGGSFHAHR